MDFVLGIDLGTSYFKLGLFDRAGEIRGLGRIFVPKDTGDGSRSEVPVHRFWELLNQALNDACRQAGAQSQQIKAIGYSSQANSFLLLDKQKKPLTPLILWSDNRARDIENVEALFQKKDFLERMGLGIECSHQFCVAKCVWFQTHQPDLWARAAHLMTISDYFTWSITDQPLGDSGTAALLGLLDLRTRKWQPDIIDLSNIQLSTPLLPGTVAGKITARGARRLNLPANIPFVVGSLDHHIAGIGAGAGHIADMSESTGTVLACLKLDSGYYPRKNICTGNGLSEDQVYQLAFEGNGAGSLEWYQRTQAPGLTIPELVQLAAAVPIGSEGLVARPNADSYPALEGFAGISPNHQQSHFTRAILESTAASLVQLVDHLSGGDPPKRIVATGGGAASDLLLQIKADLLGIEFITTQSSVPACRGAAMLAALAAGWFRTLEKISGEWVKVDRRFKPISENHSAYLEWYHQWKALTAK
ncbi:hypothetical protein JXJ21_25475 [candidate division KSB1 bacterium]|nr:hypothetical protein [candidate division KSB1 bacterium]